MAFLRKKKSSPYYEAVYEAWDAESQGWKWRHSSTKCTDKEAAERVLKEYQSLARHVGGLPHGCKLTKEYVEELVRGVLRGAGVTVPENKTRVTLEEYMKTYREHKEATASSATLKT